MKLTKEIDLSLFLLRFSIPLRTTNGCIITDNYSRFLSFVAGGLHVQYFQILKFSSLIVRLEASHDKLKALWLASYSLKQQYVFTAPPLSCTYTGCVAAIQP